MNDTLFDLAFYLAAPFWALMILAPTWSWTRRIASSAWIVAPTLVVWAILAVPLFGPLWAAVTQPSLPVLDALVADERAVALLWAQIIAWDLFIGRWMYLDSRERRVHPVLMAPILVLTILLSPIGLPIYLVVRRLVGAPEAKAADRHSAALLS
jgi:ABA4-like protein